MAEEAHLAGGAGQPLWGPTLEHAEHDRRARDGDRQAIFVEAIVQERGQRDGDEEFRRRLVELDAELVLARRIAGEASNPVESASAMRDKDKLKHERKSLVDRRTRDVDREVRRAVRLLVQRQSDDAVSWLLSHGCERSQWPGQDNAIARRMPEE